MTYARTMLVRGGAPTFGQIGSIFQGNMMRLDVQEVGIKSARGRKSGNVGGEGETQLEMERRRLTDREAKITKELEMIELKVQHEKSKKEKSHQSLPLVGLVRIRLLKDLDRLHECWKDSFDEFMYRSKLGVQGFALPNSEYNP